jgi:hypothetical protein
LSPVEILTISVAIIGTILIPIAAVLIVLYSDVQSLKREATDLEKIAGHEVRIALLEAAVTDLKRMPETLQRIENLLRTKHD